MPQSVTMQNLIIVDNVYSRFKRFKNERGITMKKFVILAIMLVVTLSFCSPVNAGEGWINLGGNEDVKACYVADDAYDEGWFCYTLVKYVFKRQRALLGKKVVEYVCLIAFPLQQFNGKKMVDTTRTATIGEEANDIRGKLVASSGQLVQDIQTIYWENVQPGTFSAAIADIVARRYAADHN